jgi:hypothetical protein
MIVNISCDIRFWAKSCSSSFCQNYHPLAHVNLSASKIVTESQSVSIADLVCGALEDDFPDIDPDEGHILSFLIGPANEVLRN